MTSAIAEVTVNDKNYVDTCSGFYNFFMIYKIIFLRFIRVGCSTPTSIQTLFVTCAEYNKCQPYRDMLIYKPLTISVVQEELRKYLPNKLKLKNKLKSNTITRLYTEGTESVCAGTG